MSDDLYVNSFDSSASSQRLSGSVAVMKGLEFPQLVDGGSNKRSAKRQPCFPSKKPRISKVPRRLEYMKEDDSWIDNFSILESMLPESDVLDAGIFPKLVSSLASIVDAAIASITSPIHGERAEESATTTCVPIQTLPPLQPSAIPLHESLGSAANVPLPEANNLMESRAVKVITPSLVPMECPPHYIPQMKDSEHIILDSPRPVIGQSSNGIEDSGDFSIERLKVSKEPTLLTSTSFPFRVVYANDAYAKLSGEKSIIGDSVFDSFTCQDLPLKPSLALYPTLLDKFQNEAYTVRVLSNGKDNGMACTIKAFAATKKDQLKGPRYYAVRFNKLDTTSA